MSGSEVLGKSGNHYSEGVKHFSGLLRSPVCLESSVCLKEKQGMRWEG